ncbi:MAG: NAD(P)-dependent methylenetetrahydromethanopterin dehydrogenase [Pseudomonadota bacterium]
MTDQRILHVLVPGEQVSPFDLTMALDAGYDNVLPYTNAGADEVVPLVQDAIFCRPPKRFASTGVLIAGHDVNLATQMLELAQGALVPPFQVALYADPNGAYSTAAALVALVEQTLDERDSKGFKDRKVAIFGTGPVGLCTAVLTAKLGAQPILCQLTENDDVNAAVRFCEHYGVVVPWVSAMSQSGKVSAVEHAGVVVTAAKAGVQILSKEVLSNAKELVVAADLNAVPPSGIEGIGAMDNNVPMDVAEDVFFALGALAIGDMKYKLQKNLFRRMIDPNKPAAVIDFMSAYDEATNMLNRQNTLTKGEGEQAAKAG